MLPYLAHIDGNREQTLKNHLENVSNSGAVFGKSFGEQELCSLIGYYHDIGKYSSAFQAYLRKPKDKQIRGSVDHSTPGLQYTLKAKATNQMISMEKLVAAFSIAGHHGGIPDYGSNLDTESASTLIGRSKRNVDDDYNQGAQSDNLRNLVYPQDSPIMLKILDNLKGKDREMQIKEFNFQFMTYVRMIFSTLVDADFLDTEAFMTSGTVRRGDFLSLSDLKERVDQYIQRFQHPTSALAIKRTHILQECIKVGDEGRHSLYQLTVPTGGGKTISSLAFAIHDAFSRKLKRQRIIYVIPYTSIIEQTAEVFRNIAGADQVIEHHHQVDWDDTEEKDDPKRLAAENWDAPIVVTTNVQFFESLFSNRPSKTRKLHNIANSVIIFDEAQMIPLNYLQACMRIIQELIDMYNCTAVFCTATQPSLGTFFPESMQPSEIISNQEQNYRDFQRCQIKIIDDILSQEELVENLTSQHQSLCIVNRKKTANDIFDALPEKGRFYLTTNLFPLHRKRVLQEIKRRLANGEICHVVSTSLVEAGVDFSFPVVYREMAGLDNIIQSAGRCNREHEHDLRDSVTWIFSLGNKYPVYIRQRTAITERVLNIFKDNPGGIEAIKMYFQKLHTMASTDAAGIMEILSKQMAPFKTVAETFHIIDDNTISLFIPQDMQPEALEEFIQSVKYGCATRKDMRQAGLYTLSVYPQVYDHLQETGKVETIRPRYGVLVDLTIYDGQKGLLDNFEEGNSIFF